MIMVKAWVSQEDEVVVLVEEIVKHTKGGDKSNEIVLS